MAPHEALSSADPASVTPTRILLKLSGEAFQGETGTQLDPDALCHIVDELTDARSAGAQVGVVVGAGNLVRGRETAFIDRATADQMGMLATLVNGLALRDALRQAHIGAVVLSAIETPWIDATRPDRAREVLDEGRVAIFVGGTGNPFVTTDTAAAIRAAEIQADALLKASPVDGIYTGDPRSDPDAERLAHLSYDRVVSEDLGALDLAAIALCREQGIPIGVYDYTHSGHLAKMLQGETVGSWVTRAR
ncbi:MAG: UMP kinase [Candidatus Bipolaricaulia bacterium]